MSAVLLTRRDTWLTRDEYMQLVYIACTAWVRAGTSDDPTDIIMEPPTILKPKPLWSGKQARVCVCVWEGGLPEPPHHYETDAAVERQAGVCLYMLVCVWMGVALSRATVLVVERQ